MNGVSLTTASAVVFPMLNACFDERGLQHSSKCPIPAPLRHNIKFIYHFNKITDYLGTAGNAGPSVGIVRFVRP